MILPQEHMVPTADIVLREDWQVRGGLNEHVVREYATATAYDAMPPIRLARVDGALMLVDGWHRLAAAKRLKRSEISALVEDMTERQACWAAAEANTTHGLPLKKAEKREVFRVYVRNEFNRVKRAYKSYRDIAAELHGLAGKSTLQRWMEQDFPKVAAAMAKGLPAKTKEPKVEERSRRYLGAIANLEQITAIAPALGTEERRLLAEQLTAAATKALTAGPWEGKPMCFEL